MQGDAIDTVGSVMGSPYIPPWSRSPRGLVVFTFDRGVCLARSRREPLQPFLEVRYAVALPRLRRLSRAWPVLGAIACIRPS